MLVRGASTLTICRRHRWALPPSGRSARGEQLQPLHLTAGQPPRAAQGHVLCCWGGGGEGHGRSLVWSRPARAPHPRWIQGAGVTTLHPSRAWVTSLHLLPKERPMSAPARPLHPLETGAGDRARKETPETPPLWASWLAQKGAYSPQKNGHL